MTAGKGGEAREAEPETEGTGKVLFAEKKKGCPTKYGRGHVSEGDAQMCRVYRRTPKHTVGVSYPKVQVCLEFCGEVSRGQGSDPSPAGVSPVPR